MDSGDANHASNGDDSAANASPPPQKRSRVRVACEPCRVRKRRCDGNTPCNMCVQFEYQCYYENHPRKRSKLVEQHAVPDENMSNGHALKIEPLVEARPSVEDISKMRSMEANSGIAFTRLLGMRLDPSSGPKLFTFGWNLGSTTPATSTSPSITEFLDQAQMYSLAMHFFQHVHPLYGFLDQDWILANIALRWSQPAACNVPDHLLCGLAALGVLFSNDKSNPALPQLVNAQKLTLESTSTMQPPSLIDVQSWVLRCLYLRSTDHPHAVWLASCCTMHLIESIGLQLEASSSIMHPAVNDDSQNPEIRRRTFWIARMLNTWVSFEYGRTRVAIRGITVQLPTSKDGDYTIDYVNLYGISCCLDPEVSDKQSSSNQLEDFLTKLEAYEPRHDGIALSKANLGLCGYRRLRLDNPNLSSELTNKIINLGLGGLHAARRMAEKGIPWWHVANVPFQTTCVFLAMDVRESLTHLATALRTLEFVVERFNTTAMKEALKTARFLVRLSKKKKDDDSDVLAKSLRKAIEDPDPQPENLAQPLMSRHNGLTETPKTNSSGEDWNLDVLNNTDFDWNFFLTADVPAFTGFAPDGTM